MKIFSALLVVYEWKPPVTGGFPSQRTVTPSFDVFVDMSPKKLTELVLVYVRYGVSSPSETEVGTSLAPVEGAVP